MTFSFFALGTKWQIIIDHQDLPKSLQKQIQILVSDFESSYSRFLPDSEVSQINHSLSTTFTVSPHLARMLSFAKKLSLITSGHFTPTLAPLLESYGYDAKLSFKQKKVNKFTNSYSIKSDTLTRPTTTKFDLGGLGKGYLIDLLADCLKQNSINFFLINAGGDIFATTKSNGQAWHAAIENPLDRSLAIAEVNLINQSLATSSPAHRHYHNFHHLLNPLTNKPHLQLLSVSVTASTALVADSCATAIFVSSDKIASLLSKKLNLSYLTLSPNGQLFSSSPNFIVNCA